MVPPGIVGIIQYRHRRSSTSYIFVLRFSLADVCEAGTNRFRESPASRHKYCAGFPRLLCNWYPRSFTARCLHNHLRTDLRYIQRNILVVGPRETRHVSRCLRLEQPRYYSRCPYNRHRGYFIITIYHFSDLSAKINDLPKMPCALMR